MPGRYETTELEVQFQHQTPNAVCFKESEHSRDLWVPKTLLDGWDEDAMHERGEYLTITVQEWWALDKGLI